MRLRRFAQRTASTQANPPSEQERQITSGLESLRESTAKEVMTPRVDVVGLASPVTFGDVVKAVRRSGHSHFPVYKDDFDHLLGVLFVKDLFNFDPPTVARSDSEGVIVADANATSRLREPYVVPETRSALEILSEMRRRRRSFAVVVDEYGGFAGVLTINGLVSELVGDLHDEYDRKISPAIVRIDERRFLVDGACAVDEVAEELGLDIPEGDYVTLGGFLFDALGHIPKESESYDYRDFTFRITRMDRRRIAKVVVETPSATIGREDAHIGTSDGK